MKLPCFYVFFEKRNLLRTFPAAGAEAVFAVLLSGSRFCGSAGARKRGIFLLCNIYQIFAVIFGKNLEVIAVEFGIERRIAEEIMVAVFGPVLFRHL